MWWKRKSGDPQPEKEVSIRASLHTGETLRITFTHDGAPRHLNIEGRGEIRLAVQSDADVTAELVGGGTRRADGSERRTPGRVRTRNVQ